MRFLLIDTRYPDSIAAWYRRHPGLERRSYDEQVKSFASSLIGETSAQAAALREAGHDAADVVANLQPAQEAWFREHGTSRSDRIAFGLSNRSRRLRQRMIGQILLAQIDHYRPDVVHLAAPDVLDVSLIREIRARSRVLVIQTATRLPDDRWQLGYDLVITSLPGFVDRFRRLGVDAEWLPLAFNAGSSELIGPMDRDIDLSFVGSVHPVHDERRRVIEAVALEHRLDIWSGDAGSLELRRDTTRVHPAVWGIDMLKALGSSRLTINVHGRTDANPPTDANNYRLFEGTGMGALLVTDRLRTLAELFVVGKEVVDFATPGECVEVVTHYLDHPHEAKAIAEAGRARTLRDHTWADRMRREVDLVKART